ncbi:pre-rRNA-processing protein TSR1 homolog isoform X2 [Centruroides vittatus]|uniref:pre-rRNA-processing protein TSR1 homolog isoform X2 n=1 Tax=Centruroides vittatus TaxID=120091 RepID=UPI00350EE22D
MSASNQVVHRPGLFKQQNKSHKHGRHRSNRALEVLNKGRVSVKASTKKTRQELRKCDRRNQLQQIRKNKRDDILMKKRSLGGQGQLPFLVVIVPLSNTEDPFKLLEKIKLCDDAALVTSDNCFCYISIPRFKQTFSFVIIKPGDIYNILDVAKIANTVLFLHSLDGKIDEQLLTLLFAQGLPSTTHVIQGLENVPIKRRTDVKKNVQNILEKRFPDEKLHSVDSHQEALLLLRFLGSQKQKSLSFRDHRPHMLSEVVSFEPYQNLNDPTNQKILGTLKVSGYIRGQPLHVNKLIHISGWGDFQLSQIDKCTHPHALLQKRKKESDIMFDSEDVEVLEKADASKQESLDSENVVDPMEGEQTWPTEEEIAEVEALQQKKTLKEKIVKKKIPKGTSDYQATWIVESDTEDKTDESDDYIGDECEPFNEKCDSDSCMEEDSVDHDDSADGDGDDDDDDDDKLSTSREENPDTYDDKMNVDDNDKMLMKFREERLNQLFPDEVDTPLDIPAKVRFARYRGLKSFRSSPWDPKENLPPDYARIFQFENFNRTRKRILSEERLGVLPGNFVTLHVVNVPEELFESYKNHQNPLSIFGLLPYEQKMSLVNVVLKKHSSYNEPIKSKEPLIFHIGYRRFEACPIFSDHNFGKNHKFERFLQHDTASVASFYAPIIFPPNPVLVFKKGSLKLIATGSVLNADPNRIIIKRVVLSGHPFKINRKSAIVRYMFFNRDDILWFKPVELRTKYGRRGHIKEPLGTHGHMKCIFDKQLMSQDTVLMNLYKRVFPKWTYNKDMVNSPLLSDSLMYDMEME